MADKKEKPAEYMSYPEYLVNIKKGIVTEDGHCPVTPLLIMLQGRWKSQLMYEMCIYDTVRFGQLKKDHQKAVQRDSTACGIFPDGNGKGPASGILCDYELGI